MNIKTRNKFIENNASPVRSVPAIPIEGFARLPTVRAALGNISTATVYRMVKRGQLPPPHKLTPHISAWCVVELRACIERLNAATRRGGDHGK